MTNEAEGGGDDFTADEAESDGPGEAGSSTANGHGGNGTDFAPREAPRAEPRSGPISWTGLSVAEVAPAVEIPVTLPATELEPSAIDTAELPTLESSAEDDIAASAAPLSATVAPLPLPPASTDEPAAPAPSRVVWSSSPPAVPPRDRGPED